MSFELADYHEAMIIHAEKLNGLGYQDPQQAHLQFMVLAQETLDMIYRIHNDDMDRWPHEYEYDAHVRALNAMPDWLPNEDGSSRPNGAKPTVRFAMKQIQNEYWGWRFE